MLGRLRNTLTGKKNTTRKNTPLPKAATATVAPGASAAAGAGAGAEDPSAPAAWTQLNFPKPPSTDPRIVMEVKKLQLPGFVLSEETFQSLIKIFETRIKINMSTLFSIQYAIHKALQNSIVEKETIYALLNRGDRTLKDILPLYLKKGGAIDVVIYNTVYPILMDQHIKSKVSALASSMPMPPSGLPGTKGGRRTKRSRKQRKTKSKKQRKIRSYH